MEENPDTNEAFEGLLILMRLIWGRFFWPILVANAPGAVVRLFDVLTPEPPSSLSATDARSR